MMFVEDRIPNVSWDRYSMEKIEAMRRRRADHKTFPQELVNRLWQ